MRRMLRSPLGMVTAVLAVLLVGLAIFAPIIWGHQATTDHVESAGLGPGSGHPLGTDGLGRDILARTLVATRLSLLMALAATGAGAVIGTLLGIVPVVLPPVGRRLFASVIDIWLAFPVLLLAMFISIMMGTGVTASIVALAATMVPAFARLAQTLSASVGGSEYMAAAKVLGIPRHRQLTHYVLPNIAEPLILNATISVGGGLLALSSLSFLGIGVKAPSYDWGRLLGDGLDSIYTTPTTALTPAVAIVLAAGTFSLLGEVLTGAVRGKPAALPERAPAAAAAAPGAGQVLLDVEGLRVKVGGAEPVRGVSFQVRAGEIVGLVGESGSGKSLTTSAIAGLIPAAADRLHFAGRDLRGLSDAGLRRALGTDLGYIPQSPMTSLNPALRVGRQLAEIPEVHRGSSRKQARRQAIEALRSVRINAPEQRVRQFPHEFSGGMRQRALIAMARIGDPKLIIADEPTTALDVTVQQHILALIKSSSAEQGTAALVVSHDIALLAGLCSRILVMYGGRIVEELATDRLGEAVHPYTRALLGSLPDLDTDRSLPLVTIAGRPPAPDEIGAGCSFADRCDRATADCLSTDPVLTPHPGGGMVACLNPLPAGEVTSS